MKCCVKLFDFRTRTRCRSPSVLVVCCDRGRGPVAGCRLRSVYLRSRSRVHVTLCNGILKDDTHDIGHNICTSFERVRFCVEMSEPSLILIGASTSTKATGNTAASTSVVSNATRCDHYNPMVREVNIPKLVSGSCGFDLSRSKWDPYPWVCKQNSTRFAQLNKKIKNSRIYKM